MSKKVHEVVGALLGAIVITGLTVLPSVSSADISTSSSGLSSSKVQQAIVSKKAKWTARESWITRLSHIDVKRMLGLKTRPSMDAEFRSASKSHIGMQLNMLASGIDWRNKDGVNWVSPVLNQGNCGSCVAFSSVGTLETQVNVTSGIPGLNPAFSTQALFACGGGSCDSGWEPGDAASFFKDTGAVDEACAPYTSGASGQDVSCGSICSDSASRAFKIVDFHQPTSGWGSTDAVKTALQNGPVVTTMTVYGDFLYYSGGVYKHVSGDAEGGHAVSIVGYDDAAQAWIVRNSWGADWGDNGFVRVAYDDDSGVGSETWSYEVPHADGYIVMDSPRERSFVSGTETLSAKSTFPGTSSISYSITDTQGRQVIAQNSCSAASVTSCLQAVDSTKLADGQYDVVATAHYGSKTVNSQHSIIYVINKAPSLTLNITGSDHDLTQPLADRVVFNLDALTGSTVPFTSITFHVVQGGKEVYSKLAPIVVDKMTLGWRTGSVPNGAYEIFFTGEIVTPQGQRYTAETAHSQVSVANGSSANGSPVAVR